jgi:amidase
LTALSLRNVRRRTVAAAAAVALASAVSLTGVGSAPAQAAPTTRGVAPTINLETATIQQLHRLFVRGKVTAAMLGKLYLARIAAMNTHGPGLNAVRSINPSWQADAAKVDKLRARGIDLGPMMGIPILVKDNVDVAGLPTTAGSVALQNSYPAKDAPQITQLKAAGAIILGKANMAEFAYWMTSGAPNGYSSLGGQVLNPYDAALNPGGSSSGSGSAVAAGLVPAAVGSDTGGSILQPSSFMSDIGIRPTVGLISRNGVIPISATSDTTGPIAHTVWDAAAMLSAMTTGVDAADPATATAGPYNNVDYTKTLSATSLQGARLGYVAPATPDPLFDAALQSLRDQGATLVQVDVNSANLPTRVWDYEFKKGLNAYLGQLPSKDTVRSLADVIAYNQAHPAVALKFGETLLDQSQAINITDPATVQTNESLITQGLADARGRIDNALQANNITAIVFAGTSGNTNAARAAYPAVMARAGYQAGNLHPEGLEFVGTAYSEATLLSYAYDYEQATKLWQPPSVINPTLFRCVGTPVTNPTTCAP